jgi:hypothetical protein
MSRLVLLAFPAAAGEKDKPVYGEGPWRADAQIEMRAPK